MRAGKRSECDREPIGNTRPGRLASATRWGSIHDACRPCEGAGSPPAADRWRGPKVLLIVLPAAVPHLEIFTSVTRPACTIATSRLDFEHVLRNCPIRMSPQSYSPSAKYGPSCRSLGAHAPGVAANLPARSAASRQWSRSDRHCRSAEQVGRQDVARRRLDQEAGRSGASRSRALGCVESAARAEGRNRRAGFRRAGAGEAGPAGGSAGLSAERCGLGRDGAVRGEGCAAGLSAAAARIPRPVSVRRVHGGRQCRWR